MLVDLVYLDLLTSCNELIIFLGGGGVRGRGGRGGGGGGGGVRAGAPVNTLFGSLF